MRVEHLVLKPQTKFLHFKWVTRYHDDLGDDLQLALDVVEGEGWEAIGAVPLGPTSSGMSEFAILLKRPKEKTFPDPDR